MSAIVRIARCLLSQQSQPVPWMALGALRWPATKTRMVSFHFFSRGAELSGLEQRAVAEKTHDVGELICVGCGPPFLSRNKVSSSQRNTRLRYHIHGAEGFVRYSVESVYSVCIYLVASAADGLSHAHASFAHGQERERERRGKRGGARRKEGGADNTRPQEPRLLVEPRDSKKP